MKKFIQNSILLLDNVVFSFDVISIRNSYEEKMMFR